MKDDNHAEREKYHKEVLDAIKDIAASHKDLDERIKLLEKWKWYVMGAAAAVGVVLAQIPWDNFLF
jgi:hypothetical protein